MQTQTHTFFHGTNQPKAVIEAIMGAGRIRAGFHMTPSREVAENYGSHVIAIEVEGDIPSAHVGMINKEGNFNRNVGNGIEVVIRTPAAMREFYDVIYDARAETNSTVSF